MHEGRSGPTRGACLPSALRREQAGTRPYPVRLPLFILVLFVFIFVTVLLLTFLFLLFSEASFAGGE